LRSFARVDYGSAGFFGSSGSIVLNKAVVGMAPT
jgi:hypothetical protein